MSRIRDVASSAGVSVSTVSRYLNRRIVLPAPTAERIDAAAVALNYRPNGIARRLSMGRSETIGLVTPDIANPFFAEIAATVEARAAASGYSVFVIGTGGSPERELAVFDRLEDQVVDGLIMMTERVGDGALSRRINETRRVVLLDEDVAGAEAPRVFAENEDGARRATAVLIRAGHERVAHLGGPAGLLSSVERLAGFRAALSAAGLPVAAELIRHGPYLRAAGREGMQDLLALASPPTAVFAGSDVLAIGALEAIREAGLRVPEDLSVVGFDDMPLADMLSPPLTTVRQPVSEMAATALDALLQLIGGAKFPPPLVRLPVTLVERGTVSPPASKGTPEGPSLNDSNQRARSSAAQQGEFP